LGKGVGVLNYNQQDKPQARTLRKTMTEAERVLWSRWRRKQIQNVQFYRQKCIGDFIVDFYAPKVQLVIEVDGSQHFETPNQIKDEQREVFLNREGLQVIRFHHGQVLQEIESVMEVISQQ